MTPPSADRRFEGAIDLVFHPDGQGTYFVAYRDGLIEHRDAMHAVLSQHRLPVRRGDECGLLAIEADPRFVDNRRFYVGYCVPDDGVNVASFEWRGDGSTIAPTATSTIVSVPASPGNQHHNVGDIGWDDAEHLWITYGDGNRAFEFLPRDLTDLRGKLLRVTPYRDGQHGYTVPRDNPFVGDTTKRPEIVAFGLKSTFRADYAEGTWFLADVGLEHFEEVNLVRLDSERRDFGYPACDGHTRLDENYRAVGDCDLGAGYAPPALAYPNVVDQPAIADDPAANRDPDFAWAIVGGVLVTSDRYGATLRDHYVYADIFRGFVRAARFTGSDLVEDRHVGHLERILVFAQGPDGWLYAIADNTLWRLAIETSSGS